MKVKQPGGNHRHYPCSHRGYILKEMIGRGSYGKVYKANVCTISWERFVKAAEHNGIGQGVIESLKEAGIDKNTDRLLEANDIEIRDIIGVRSKVNLESIFDAVESSRTETKQRVAIKILDEDRNEWEDVQREIHIMHDVHHENIVSVYAAFLKNGPMDQVWLVMPLLGMGSLRGMIKEVPRFKHGIKDPKLLASILEQILSALVYLHEDGRVHRDLKAANLLMSEDGEIKLGDFGLTANMAYDLESFVGTPNFMAPEVIKGRSYCMKADVWSFGITALELAYGKTPNSKLKGKEILAAIVSNPAPSCSSHCYERHKLMPRTFRKLIEKCLHKDPNQRPTARQLLSFGFFKNTRGKEYIINSCVKHILATCDKRRKKEASNGKLIAPEHTKYWMLPDVGSFILPESCRRKLGNEGQRRKDVRMKSPQMKDRSYWLAPSAHEFAY
uniref:Protein kinase domain-containing protein n=1 Tax=Lotharella oceanica TaxID=641309 RepID=A0A7S2TPM6_9EUKA|mmetsp:Transcript_24100/g.45053  ORF Transcript_24100/g.45053 Transcript_24100/m.45053 type:complete len:444 (+) Transcript_24100:3-1334(+)